MKPIEVKRLLRKFIPHLNVDTIYDIDLQALKSAGVKGIITDLDNTLVGAKDPHATPKLVEWLKNVSALGFQVVIVSNNRRLRVETFATPLSIPYIYRAKKPANFAFRKALLTLGLAPEETVVIGDQMLTDVFGGNRIGLYTILVTPISLKDEGFTTKINRRIEKTIIAILKRRGFLPWEDHS
jgi:HAD superfamily phosphatase (TIGR01668 family)